MVDPDITSRFNELYDSAYRDVLLFITAKCGNTADIRDIAQETWLELYQLLCRRGAAYVRSGRAIALKIARQKLSRHYARMERRRDIISLTAENEDGDAVTLSDFEAEAFWAEDVAVNQLLVEQARQLIRQRPEEVKKVFYLFYDMDCSIPEIAKALSMSESNVKHKLYRTLKELRALLQAKE